MNIIERNLIHKSCAVFDHFDKWKAFLELKTLSETITWHWLGIGTKYLRDYFDQNPSEGWGWKEWGSPPDTRWYLKKFGPDSLAIGFGWRYEFHLRLEDTSRFNSNLIDELVKGNKYAALMMHFDADSNSSSTVRTLPEDKCSRNAGFFMHVNRPTSKCSGKF
jgi:hypothetical protein